MKIYEFKHYSGACDWVYAPSKKEAKEFYSNLIGDTLEDMIIKQIPKKRWKDMTIINSENENENSNFNEWVKNNDSICDIIATTEF